MPSRDIFLSWSFHHLGNYQKLCVPVMSKLLVTSRSNISVINLDETQSDLVCDDLPPFPITTVGATGKLFQGQTPIICGGYQEDYLCDCHALTDGAWTSIESLNTCRFYSSSVLLSFPIGKTLDEHLLVIGGASNQDYTAKVEAFDGKTWQDSTIPDRPSSETQFCNVRINETTLLSLGGPIDFMKRSFFYNSLENSWTLGPNLIKERNGLACGIINWLNPDTGTKEQVVVAASGEDLHDSELLFLKDYNESGTGWVEGPSLPAEAFLASMIEYNDSIILVGGLDGVDGYHLYKLSSPFGSWEEMDLTLKEPHGKGVAFLVPDELVNCYKSS